MQVSLFTPTHKPKWLPETYQSLLEQTYTQWEWVLVPNNGAVIPEQIQQDPRVRVVAAPASLQPGVGALKKFACQHCQGELLVELDHDDLLTPQALDILVYQAQQGAEFLYSDYVNFYTDYRKQQFLAYGPRLGWDAPYLYIYQGYPCVAVRDFDPSPSSLSSLTFAPNHVRAWTRKAYDAAGGHNENLPVLDDYDLVCRTYLTGAKFYHIPEVLYLYRLHEKNTWKEEPELMSQLRLQLSRRYLYPLIEEWCRRQHYHRLYLGPTPAPDNCIQPDQTQIIKTQSLQYHGIQIPDQSVGCIRAYDFLHYLPPLKIKKMMAEFYRVLAPGGWLLTYTPSTDGAGAFADPSYVSFWNRDSFYSLAGECDEANLKTGNFSFRIYRNSDEFPSVNHQAHNLLYVRADLVALKGQLEPRSADHPKGTCITSAEVSPP